MEKEKSIGVSKLLEESMENTAVLMTLEERHLMRERIDRLDDARRVKREEEENKRINEISDVLLKYRRTADGKFLRILAECIEDYKVFLDVEREKERYLEELDDLDREKFQEQLKIKKEECKNRSYRIEVRIIENHKE